MSLRSIERRIRRALKDPGSCPRPEVSVRDTLANAVAAIDAELRAGTCTDAVRMRTSRDALAHHLEEIDRVAVALGVKSPMGS